MANVFFTSDLHLGHRKVSDIRGHATTYDHDEAVMQAWSVVRPVDEVWVLGDLAASSPTHALSLLAMVPGRLHLIAGNHDKVHPMHRDAHKHLRRYLDVFDSVASAARRRVEGREVLLSHFPYYRDRGEPRHTQWRLREEGLPLLHGHTHGQEKLTVTPTWGVGLTRPRPIVEVHVGWDAWGRLVTLDDVAELLQEVP